MQAAPYAGVSHRGMGDACFIKALFHLALYCINVKYWKKKKKKLLRSSFADREMQTPQTNQYSLNILDNLTVSVKAENTR